MPEYKNTQIIRKDAKNCFVETKSDCFNINKVVLNFLSYDASKPEGQRSTGSVSIFMPVDDLLLLNSQILSGFLAEDIKSRREAKDNKPIYSHLGGKNAEKAGRADGKALSRNVSLSVGYKGLFFTAEEGPGEVSGSGIIVPKYTKPEQKVSVSLSYEDFVRLITTTKAHFDAWLCSKYLKES